MADTPHRAPTQHRDVIQTRRSGTLTLTAERTTAARSKRRQSARRCTDVSLHAGALERDICMYSHVRACLSAHAPEPQWPPCGTCHPPKPRGMHFWATVPPTAHQDRPPPSYQPWPSVLSATCTQSPPPPLPRTAHDTHNARPPYQLATTAAAIVRWVRQLVTVRLTHSSHICGTH